MQIKSTTRLDPRTENLVGKPPFGRLTVEKFAGYRNGNAYWTCRCICGVVKNYWAHHLKDGTTQSCGCWQKELTSQNKRTHGMTDTPEFKAWQQMKERCTNPKSRFYTHYGERGITVCESWAQSFEAFFQDMGKRPGPEYSIERQNNNLGYTPQNCVWATRKEQARNRRTSKYVTHNGVTKTLTEWADSAGLSLPAFRQRLLMGWTVEDALKPVRPLSDSGVPTILTLHGITQSLGAWAKQYGLSYSALHRRLRRGASLEEALSKPLKPQLRPKDTY